MDKPKYYLEGGFIIQTRIPVYEDTEGNPFMGKPEIFRQFPLKQKKSVSKKTTAIPKEYETEETGQRFL